MKIITVSLTIFFLFGLFISLSAQPLNIQWQKCLGGTLGEVGNAVRQTSDGGFMVLSEAVSNDGDVSGNHSQNSDFWVVKLDSAGFLEWQKCYGGSVEDFPYSMYVSGQGGFIAAGASGSNDGDVSGNHMMSGDFWIVKGDSSGAIEWAKSLGGSNEDYAYQIIHTYDDGYLVTGRTQSDDFDVTGRHDSSICPTCSDAWIVKLNSSGMIEWSKCYGGYFAEVGRSIIQTQDSGFVLAASTMSDNGDVSGIHNAFQGGAYEDYWIVKIDSVGFIQWQKCYGGSEVEIPLDISETFDGGYIITGIASSTDYDVVGHHDQSNYDAWIVKTDSSGNMEWQKCLGGSDDDVSKKIIQLEDSGYLALCYTVSTDGDLTANPPTNVDGWLVKLDQFGNILWQQLLGGSYADAFYDLQQTNDKGFIITGLTNSNDGDVSGNHGDYDAWVIKLAPLPDGINYPIHSITDFTCYPNPINHTITIKYYSGSDRKILVQVLDIAGRIISQEYVGTLEGFNKQEISTGDIS